MVLDYKSYNQSEYSSAYRKIESGLELGWRFG